MAKAGVMLPELQPDSVQQLELALEDDDLVDRGKLIAKGRCKRWRAANPASHGYKACCGAVAMWFAQGMHDTPGEHVTVQIAKRSELHTFKVMPKCWVVERSFAWLEKNRRLWKNCERWLNTSLR